MILCEVTLPDWGDKTILNQCIFLFYGTGDNLFKDELILKTTANDLTLKSSLITIDQDFG